MSPSSFPPLPGLADFPPQHAPPLYMLSQTFAAALGLNHKFGGELRHALTTLVRYCNAFRESDPVFAVLQTKQRHVKCHARLKRSMFALAQRNDLSLAPIRRVVDADGVSEPVP